MTTPSTPRKAGPLLGTGAQTSWPFTFKVFAASDIAVTIANNLGVETALVLNADYSVTLNANQDTSPGGTVTYPISGAALPTGSKLTIFGNLPYDQPLDLPSGGNFSPLALENELDRLTMQIQQLRELASRSLQLPVTSAPTNVQLPQPTASNIIGWNENGDNLENYPLEELATSLAFATYRYDTFTGNGSTTQFTLSADPVTLGNLDVAISGVTQVPGADYALVAGVLQFTSAPANGTVILARYGEGIASGPSMDSYDVRFRQAGTGSVDRTAEAKMRETVSVKDFGAVGNGVADDTAAIQAAINSGASKIYIPAGRYRTTQTIKAISTEQAPLYIYGEGSQSTIISFEPATYLAGNDTALWFGNSTQNLPSTIYECRNLTLEDFAVYINANARVALRLRETLRTACKRLFLGAENYGVLNEVTCLFADGGIDCLFEQVDCAPKNGYGSGLTLPIVAIQVGNSATLDRTAGSGSGAAFTSSAFNGCYIHLANQLGFVGTNQVSFNDCIFEGANRGIVVGAGSFNTEFINCYYEAINGFAVITDGADVRVTSNIVVQGGYYQANLKAGYSGVGGFVNARNAGKVKVTDVQILSQHPCLGRAVTTTGYTHSLLLDANYYALNSSTNDFTPVSLTNPFQTVNGSPDLILNYASHGLLLEDTVSLSGFTTPLNSIPTNQPLWRVSEVVNANQVKLRSVYGDINASATGSGLGGTGNFVRYNAGFAGNFIIDAPEATKFTDAKEHWLSFGRAYTAGADNQPMYLGSDGATERYVTTSWCYLMYARRTQSKLQTANPGNYTYIFLDFPTGYEQALNLGGPAEIPVGKYQTSNFLIGRKIPPGTVIRPRNTLQGGVGGYDYTQSQTLEMLMVECNERLSVI